MLGVKMQEQNGLVSLPEALGIIQELKKEIEGKDGYILMLQGKVEELKRMTAERDLEIEEKNILINSLKETLLGSLLPDNQINNLHSSDDSIKKSKSKQQISSPIKFSSKLQRSQTPRKKTHEAVEKRLTNVEYKLSTKSSPEKYFNFKRLPTDPSRNIKSSLSESQDVPFFKKRTSINSVMEIKSSESSSMIVEEWDGEKDSRKTRHELKLRQKSSDAKQTLKEKKSRDTLEIGKGLFLIGPKQFIEENVAFQNEAGLAVALIGGKQLIIGGEFEKLVRQALLEYVVIRDQNHMDTLLYTFPVFVSSSRFMELLTAFFLAPPGLDGDEESSKKFIKLQIVNLVKKWLVELFSDFESKELVNQLNVFIDQSQKEFSTLSQSIKNLYLRNSVLHTASQLQSDPSVPTPLSFKQIMGAYSPLVVTEQLTLIQHHLFRSISLREYLCTRTRKDQCRHLTNFIKFSNELSRWIVAQIISEDDLKGRICNLEFFIHMAYDCWKICNYNLCNEIYSALSNVCVDRLKQTWKKVQSKALQKWEFLKDNLTPFRNYASLRAVITNVEPPAIPWIGLICKDIFSLEELNRDYLDDDKELSDYSKMLKIHTVLNSLIKFQQIPYNIEKAADIWNYFLDIISNSSSSISDDQLYLRSREIEPPEERSLAQ